MPNASSRSVRADTSVISQLPTQKVQSASQLFNIESADSSPDPEEGKVGPTIGTSVQSVLPGGSLTVPKEANAAEAQTEHVVYLPLTMIPDRESVCKAWA